MGLAVELIFPLQELVSLKIVVHILFVVICVFTNDLELMPGRDPFKPFFITLERDLEA